MNNIEEISRELCKIENKISGCIEHIESERNELSDIMNKTQGMFSNQQVGQELVAMLFTALNNLVYADDALYFLKSEIDSYKKRIRR